MMCALPTFMRAFNKQFHTQMKFESAFLTTCSLTKIYTANYAAYSYCMTMTDYIHYT